MTEHYTQDAGNYSCPFLKFPLHSHTSKKSKLPPELTKASSETLIQHTLLKHVQYMLIGKDVSRTSHATIYLMQSFGVSSI